MLFSLGEEECAVKIGQAQEIIRIPELIRSIPSMPSHIEGIINLRDKVLLVVDIKKSSGYAASESIEGGLTGIAAAIEQLASSATSIHTNEQTLNEEIKEVIQISDEINEISAFLHYFVQPIPVSAQG